MATSIPCALVRGGTSKGVFFDTSTFPFDVHAERAATERALRRIMGVPDPSGMQLDGLGGGITSTSKCVFVGRRRGASPGPAADLDYLFAQVHATTGEIGWGGNCGNLAAGVVPFARHCMGFPPNEALVWQVNTQRMMHCKVHGDDSSQVAISGVPGLAPPIEVTFFGGGEGGSAVLPTGNVVDVVDGTIPVTIVNASNTTIFVPADAAVSVASKADELDGNVFPQAFHDHLLETVCRDLLRTPVADSIRVCFVRRPRDPGAMDVFARISALNRYHHAMTGTGMVNLSVCAAIPGSVVEREVALPAPTSPAPRKLRIGHPSGVVETTAVVDCNNNNNVNANWTFKRVSMVRTARILMTGRALLAV